MQNEMTMQEEMRDRLVELLQEYTDNNNGGGSNHARADYLIAKGVIVPPAVVEPVIGEFKHINGNCIETTKHIRYEWRETMIFGYDEGKEC